MEQEPAFVAVAVVGRTVAFPAAFLAGRIGACQAAVVAFAAAVA